MLAAAGSSPAWSALVGARACCSTAGRRLFPLAVAAALPFRVPIAVGGSTANLLVPLYAGDRRGRAGLRGAAAARARDGEERERRPACWSGCSPASVVALRACRRPTPSDFDKALENVVFFYVPFALLFALLGAGARGRARLARALPRRRSPCSRSSSSAIGFVEYATRHLLLNPKVIASNQFESYFRVNSLFFDPNIYGRFLAIVMLGLAAVLLWARRGARRRRGRRSCSRCCGPGSC